MKTSFLIVSEIRFKCEVIKKLSVHGVVFSYVTIAHET